MKKMSDKEKIQKEAFELIREILDELPAEKRERLQYYALDAITDLFREVYGEKASQEALGMAYDIVNEVVRAGDKIIKIKAEEAEISFSIPKSVIEATGGGKNPELTYEQRLLALKQNRWARGWAKGLMKRMMPAEWEKMTVEAREKAIDRAIVDVLAPRVL